MNYPKLVIFDPDQRAAGSLRAELRELSFVSVVQGNGKEATASAQLDAIWLTWMQAEQFGITPQFEPRVATVVAAPDGMVQRGFPRLVVAGVAFLPGDPADLTEKLRITLKAILNAVATFGERHGRAIERLGTLPGNLLIGKVPTRTVADALAAAWAVVTP